MRQNRRQNFSLIWSPNPFAFDEPDASETFVLDESDEEGFNKDGIVFFTFKKVDPEKFVLKLG